MAIRENLLSRMRVTLHVGQNPDGSPQLRNRTYNRMRHTASDTAVAATAAVLGSLQQHPVLFVHRLDEARVIAQ
ncbi:MAG: DUF1659 domain-containing protein [Peptococcaceae bacterium]|nr:DUF1659 domain-containing protein [Peptococcaceae bacterium]